MRHLDHLAGVQRGDRPISPEVRRLVLNGLDPSLLFSKWQGGNRAVEGFASAIRVPAGFPAYQINAISGYISSDAAPVVTGGAVAGFFLAEANANNANMFGINPVCVDNVGLTGVHLQNEFDFNVQNVSTVITGISVQISGTANPASATAVAVQRITGSTQQWGTAFFSADDAVFRGAYFGTSNSGNGVNSQAIVFGGRDAGGVIRSPSFFGDPNGAFVIRSGGNNQAIALQDFNGGGGANIALFGILGSSINTDWTSTGALRSSGATAGIGYATGAGGTVTQATNKATGVALNKATGQITMNGAALAGDTTVSFTLTNTAIAATDLVAIWHVSGGTVGSYTVTATPAGGSATVAVRNITTGSLSEAIVLAFAIVKAVTA